MTMADGTSPDSVVVTIEDNDELVVWQIALPFGLSLVGGFGTPTTSREILDGNSRIRVIWVWDNGRDRWIADSSDLPDSLRRTLTIVIGDGFFVITSRSTFLDVPLE